MVYIGLSTNKNGQFGDCSSCNLRVDRSFVGTRSSRTFVPGDIWGSSLALGGFKRFGQSSHPKVGTNLAVLSLIFQNVFFSNGRHWVQEVLEQILNPLFITKHVLKHPGPYDHDHASKL
jgi:hypothetical protein